MQAIRGVVVAVVMILNAVSHAFAQRLTDPQLPAIIGDDPKRTLLVDLPPRPPHYRDVAMEAEMRLLRELRSVKRPASAGARNAWVCALLVALLNLIALAYARFRTSRA